MKQTTLKVLYKGLDFLILLAVLSWLGLPLQAGRFAGLVIAWIVLMVCLQTFHYKVVKYRLAYWLYLSKLKVVKWLHLLRIRKDKQQPEQEQA